MKLHRLLLPKLYRRLDALTAENKALKERLTQRTASDNSEIQLLKNENDRLSHQLDRVVSIEYAPEPSSPLYYKDRTLLFPVDKLMIPAVLHRGRWDQSMLDFAERALDRTGRYYFFDVGANIGLVTRQFLAHFPSIIGASCFEPDAGHFDLLKRNNDIFEKVSFHKVALSTTSGITKFYRDCTNIGRYSLLAQAVAGPAGKEEVTVECVKPPMNCFWALWRQRCG